MIGWLIRLLSWYALGALNVMSDDGVGDCFGHLSHGWQLEKHGTWYQAKHE